MVVFSQPDASLYAGTKGYFAHERKMSGDSSAYGEVCLLMLKHLAKYGKLDRIRYQAEYRAYFGPGGEFVGYIDSPTRLTLRKLLPLEPRDFRRNPEPMMTSIPAWRRSGTGSSHAGTLEELMRLIEEVVRVTNNNELAVVAHNAPGGAVLFWILQGLPVTRALGGRVALVGHNP